MNYLVDTQIVVWAIREQNKISNAIRRILDNDRNRIFVSMASLWKASIKMSLGKLDLKESFIDEIGQSDSTILPIEPEHLQTLRNLPHHHKDPFDRMIIAQAIHENFTLITSDPAFKLYKTKIILA